MSYPAVVCKCNLPAKKVEVKKDGPNKGKEFWACPQGQMDQCKFFEWVDNDSTKKRKWQVGPSHSPTAAEVPPAPCILIPPSAPSERTVALNLLADRLSKIEAENNTTIAYFQKELQSINTQLESLTGALNQLAAGMSAFLKDA